MRTVCVIVPEDPVTVRFKGFAFLILAGSIVCTTGLTNTSKRIAGAIFVICSRSRYAENATVVEFGMRQQCTGVHNTDQNTLAGISFSVGLRRINVRKTMLVLLLADITIGTVLFTLPRRCAAELAFFHISSICNTRRQ